MSGATPLFDKTDPFLRTCADMALFQIRKAEEAKGWADRWFYEFAISQARGFIAEYWKLRGMMM